MMMPLDVSPDFTAVNGTSFAQVIGALLTIVLVVSVAALITAVVMWVYGEVNGFYQAAQKGKQGVLIALGAAVLSGAGVAWTNYLIHLGEQL